MIWLVIASVVLGVFFVFSPNFAQSAWYLLPVLGVVAVIIFFNSQNSINQENQVLENSETKITELEQRVARHQRALDDLADGLDVCIFLTDEDLNVLYANRKACETFDFLDPIGQSVLAITLSKELEELASNSLSSDETHTAELTIRHPSERRFYASSWVESGERGRLFISLYDITDLKRLERMRRDFVANVSHELRTPMATIRAMAETIMDEPKELSNENKTYLNKIISEIDRLSRISEDLLTLSLSETGSLKRTKTDMVETVSTVIQQLAPKAKKKDLELVELLPEFLDANVNQTQMSQVVYNLVENALNYTQEGSVIVSLEESGLHFKVSVKDTGIGIPEADVERVFERFYRVDKSRSRATGGTGLGLAIVRHIVESHGGSISVESKLNQGSTFTVEIPLSD